MVEGPETARSEEAIQQKNEAPKKKSKEDKQPTKVVIRRLPGTMTEESFLEHISPLFEHDYFYFVRGENLPFGDHNFSRAYINFIHVEDVFTFTQKFDDYVFIDNTGQEFPAVVEFSPFQRIPKNRINRKNDPMCGTIDEDTDYQEFLQFLESEEQPTNQLTEHYFDLANDENEERVTTTPLIEYLTSKKNDWLKYKEEKKEERRKRDLERRKLKEETKRIKKELKEAHKTALEKISKLKDDKKDNEHKHSEDVKSSSVRPKGKSYQEERQRDLARRKQEEKPFGSGDMKESKNGDYEKPSSADHAAKVTDEKTDCVKEENKSDHGDKIDNHRKSDDKKAHRDDERRYGYGRDREDKKSFYGQKKRDYANGYEYDKYKSSKRDGHHYEDYKTRSHSSYQKSSYTSKSGNNSKMKDYEEKSSKRYETKKKCYQADKEHRSSEGREDRKSSTEPKVKKDEKRENTVQEDDCRSKAFNSGPEGEPKFKDGKGDDRKDERAERRIKNKDRPALEIYRPGMGKFSRHRIERNKFTDCKDED